jgi:hypothetical protein
MPVDLVTIHHQGGGAPTDDMNFSGGGYCYGIGVTLFERWRAPVDGWATLNYNGEDLTICLSGSRHPPDNWPITDDDLELIHGAFMDSYERDEVTPDALVRAHRNSPGSATACPGDRTIDRWDDVVAACRPTPLPVIPETPDEGTGDDMEIIELRNKKQPANEQPFAVFDKIARKVWSYNAFRITWDGGGVSTLHGDADPRWIGVPGTAPAMSWSTLTDDSFDTQGGTRKRICVYGPQGAQWTGTAHV